MTQRGRSAPDHYPAVPAAMTDEASQGEIEAESPVTDVGDAEAPAKSRSGSGRWYPSVQTMREATAAVFRDLQRTTKGPGQCPHYLKWARENPTEFYKLAARLIPIQVESESSMIGVLIVEGLND